MIVQSKPNDATRAKIVAHTPTGEPMNTYLVAMLARYVLVDARDETQARELTPERTLSIASVFGKTGLILWSCPGCWRFSIRRNSKSELRTLSTDG
jgi:hypothetical protein